MFCVVVGLEAFVCESSQHHQTAAIEIEKRYLPKQYCNMFDVQCKISIVLSTLVDLGLR